MGPLQASLVLLAGVGVAHGAVLVDQIAGAVHIGHAEGGQEVHAQTDASEGNLIVGVAVAVGVLLLEGGQHSHQLVHGGGHFQAQVLQPLHVDDRHVAGHGALGHAGGQGVDMPVGGGGDGLERRHFLKGLRQVGHVLRNQVLQGEEILHVVDDVGLVEGLETQHHVGQHTLAASQQNGLLVAPVVGGHNLPFNLHVGFLLQVHQEGIGGEGIAHVAPAHGQHAEGDGLVHNGHALGVEARGDLRHSRRAGEQHGQRKHQGQQLFHGSTSFYLLNGVAAVRLRG